MAIKHKSLKEKLLDVATDNENASNYKDDKTNEDVYVDTSSGHAVETGRSQNPNNNIKITHKAEAVEPVQNSSNNNNTTNTTSNSGSWLGNMWEKVKTRANELMTEFTTSRDEENAKREEILNSLSDEEKEQVNLSAESYLINGSAISKDQALLMAQNDIVNKKEKEQDKINKNVSRNLELTDAQNRYTTENQGDYLDEQREEIKNSNYKDLFEDALKKSQEDPDNVNTALGNIDINHRETYYQDNGEMSQYNSVNYVADDGSVYVIPTITEDGKQLDYENRDADGKTEADRYFEQTGKHFGHFDTEEDADDYSQALHDYGAIYYADKDTGGEENFDITQDYRTMNEKVADKIDELNNYEGKWYNSFLEGSKGTEDLANIVRDGFQAEDIGKGIYDVLETAVSTTAEAGLRIIKPFNDLGTSIANFGASAIAQVADWTGHDEFADTLRASLIQNGESTFEQYFLNPVDERSIAGDTTDMIEYGVGNTIEMALTGEAIDTIGGKIAGKVALKAGKTAEEASKIAETAVEAHKYSEITSKLGVKMPVLAGVQSLGNNLAEGYADSDYKNWEVWTKALGSAGIDMYTEGINSVLGVGGSNIEDKFLKWHSEDITSGFGKAISRLLKKSTLEGTEEVEGDIFNCALNNFIGGLEILTKQGDGSKWLGLSEMSPSKLIEDFSFSFVSSLISDGSSTYAQTNSFTNSNIETMQEKLGRELTTEEKQKVAKDSLLYLEQKAENDMSEKTTEILEDINNNELQKQESGETDTDVNELLDNSSLNDDQKSQLLEQFNNDQIGIGDIQKIVDNNPSQNTEVVEEEQPQQSKEQVQETLFNSIENADLTLEEKETARKMVEENIDSYVQDPDLVNQVVENLKTEEQKESEAWREASRKTTEEKQQQLLQSEQEEADEKQAWRDAVDKTNQDKENEKNRLLQEEQEEEQAWRDASEKAKQDKADREAKLLQEEEDEKQAWRDASEKAKTDKENEQLRKEQEEKEETKAWRDAVEKTKTDKENAKRASEEEEKNEAQAWRDAVERARQEKVDATNTKLNNLLGIKTQTTETKKQQNTESAIEVLDKSSLTDAQKAKILQEFNDGDIGIGDVKKLAQNVENQDTTIENEANKNQEQQTISNEDKIAENEASNEIEQDNQNVSKNEENSESKSEKAIKDMTKTELENKISDIKQEYADRRQAKIEEAKSQFEDQNVKDAIDNITKTKWFNLYDIINELRDRGIYSRELQDKIEKATNFEMNLNSEENNVLAQYENELNRKKETLQSNLLESTEEVVEENDIQGLEDYSRDEIKAIAKNYIQNKLEDSEIQADIQGLEIIGSRQRGNARADSDLDIVVELNGDDLREDDLFNTLNDMEDQLEIDGIKVDINPILAEDSGTLEEFLTRSKQYDQEVLNENVQLPIAVTSESVEDLYNEPTNSIENESVEDLANEIKEQSLLEQEQDEEEGKDRSYYQTTIESDYVSQKARNEAQKLLKSDRYIPISNNETISKATQAIEKNGKDNIYTALEVKFNSNERMTLQDLAQAELLIQQYSYMGDKESLQKAKNLIRDTSIMGTELGQMVQALSIIKKSTPANQLRVANKIAERLSKQNDIDISISQETQDKILSATSQEEANKAITEAYEELAEQMPRTLWEELDSFRYLCMLGNIKTHVRNFGGNIAMHTLNNVKNGVSGVIQDVYGLVDKNYDQTNSLRFASKEQKDFAWEDMKTMKDSIDSFGNKYKDSATSEIEQARNDFNTTFFGKTGVLNPINWTLNKLSKGNSFLLDAEDKLGLQWAYYDAMKDYLSANDMKVAPTTEGTKLLLNKSNYNEYLSLDTNLQLEIDNINNNDMLDEKQKEKAIRQATKRSNARGKELQSISDKNLRLAREFSVKQAQEATFHQYNFLATKLNEIEERGGVGGFIVKAVLPFKKTPLNILKTGVEYSPIGLATSTAGIVKDIAVDMRKLNDKFEKGEITEQEYREQKSAKVNNRIDKFSKGLTGTALTLLGFIMAQSGKLKASDDDDEAEFEDGLGNQEYAITIGNYSVSLDWLSPSAMPLFIGAEVSNLLNKDEDVSTAEKIASGLFTASNPAFETTMLSNVSSAFNSYASDSSERWENVFSNIISNYTSSYISSMATNLYKTFNPDTTIRSTTSTKQDTFDKLLDTSWNNVKQRLPVTETYELLTGESAEGTAFEQLPASYNSLGEEQHREDSMLLRAVNNFVNPATIKDISDLDDSSIKKLETLSEKTDTNVLPSSVDKSYTINKQSYRMDNEQYAEAKETYGTEYKTTLEAFMNNSNFNKLDTDTQAEYISDMKTYARECVKANFAKELGIDYESENEMYNSITNVIEAGGSKEDYIKFLVDTNDMTDKSEKVAYLNSQTYSKNEDKNTAIKNAIYENDIGAYKYVKSGEDEKFSTLKVLTGGNVSEGYTDYVQKSSEDYFKADVVGYTKYGDEKTATGWTEGSKRTKLRDYLNSADLTNMEKYYIAVAEGQGAYLLTDKQRKKLRDNLVANKDSIDQETYDSMIKKLDDDDSNRNRTK